jgi:hypothetical protein
VALALYAVGFGLGTPLLLWWEARQERSKRRHDERDRWIRLSMERDDWGRMRRERLWKRP